MDSIEGARREFAEKIRGLAALRSDGLVRAFASVPREEFVGPGPWQIVPPSEFGRGYVATPNADPRHLYDNVLVALDASRHLNNGEPAALARWLDSLEWFLGTVSPTLAAVSATTPPLQQRQSNPVAVLSASSSTPG
jgi:protein-L-isoaspartate(D-aspartate) O-methyltransferase